MDRLQKKCFMASAGLHLLLGLILVVGPAFVVSKSKPDNIAVLDFVPLKTVDSLMSGGGNPNATPPPAPITKPEPPAPAPVVRAPPPLPEKVKEPDPPKEVVKEPAPPKEPDFSFEPARKDNSKKPVFEFTPVTRTVSDAKAEARKKAEAEAAEQERQYAKAVADRRRSINSAVGNALNSLEENRSGSTTLELKGPGGGGLPYANFLAGVKTVYESAWIVPDGITDENATVTASVTIARDGRVVSKRITRSSANAAVDRSVQVTLDRVKRAVPLPDDAKEDQRTVEIKFNVAAKRAMG
jgi:colicin import membrane protein